MSFGTLDINQSSRMDLIWCYKQGFEAMANTAYQYQDNQEETFESPIITKLKNLHHQNIRIHACDFKKIPIKCIPSMLQHQWIFADWSTDEIYTAILLSIRCNNIHNKHVIHSRNNVYRIRKENHIFIILLQIIGKLMEMGHTLYPFCKVKYDENIIHQLSDNQIVLYTKCTGIDSKDLNTSYTKFLSNFGIHTLPTLKSELNDLNLFSEIMNHTFLKEERYYYIKTLWQLRTVYKRRTDEALQSSDMHRANSWEANITKIISSYL